MSSRPELINGTDSTIKRCYPADRNRVFNSFLCLFQQTPWQAPFYTVYHDNYVFPFFTALHRLRVRGDIEENTVVYACSVSLICTGTLIFLGSTEELWFFAKYKMVAK
jgi:hypothetical protein